MKPADPTPWAGIPATGPMLRPAQAAAYLGCSRTTFYALVNKGVCPQPIKIGFGHNGVAGIPRPWLDALIASRAEGAAAA